jgi:hypothetical protein
MYESKEAQTRSSKRLMTSKNRCLTDGTGAVYLTAGFFAQLSTSGCLSVRLLERKSRTLTTKPPNLPAQTSFAP